MWNCLQLWQSFQKLQVDADVILNYAWGYDIEYYFLFATRAPYVAVGHYVP